MEGFAIVKIEADAAAVEENIVQQFNEYMQRSQPSQSHPAGAGGEQSGQRPIQSFVLGNEGYFRLEYGGKTGVSSAPIEAFGNFLLSTGYSVNGISTAATAEGSEGTGISFVKGGREAHVVLSTVRVY